MKKEKKERLLQEQFQQTCNKLLALKLDRMDYPDFNPDRAEQLTQELLASGRLAVAPEGMKGLCV